MWDFFYTVLVYILSGLFIFVSFFGGLAMLFFLLAEMFEPLWNSGKK